MSSATQITPLDFFDVFQLAGLGIFLFAVVLRAVSVARKARRMPIHLSLRHNGVQHGIVLLLFIGVNLWAAMILLHVLRPDRRFLSALLDSRWVMPWVQSVGVALILGGFALFVLGLRALGGSWRLGIDEQHPGALITTGVYAFSRHPIYLFFNLYFLGTFLLNGAVIFLGFWLFAAVMLHLQMLQEERFLIRVHGSAYLDYTQATHRYLTLPLRRKRAGRGVFCRGV